MGLWLTLALCLVLPAQAAAQTAPRKASADRQAKPAKTKRPAGVPTIPPVPPAVLPEAGGVERSASGQPRSMPMPVESAPHAAPPAPPAPTPQAPSLGMDTPAVNPYLAGWFVPTPVSDLPRLAAQQLTASAQWTYANVVNLPGNVIDALPKIRRVFPTGGRELWVANLKCPAEMVTGQYFFPANALRDAVNGLLGTINEMRVFNFDIQLVCS